MNETKAPEPFVPQTDEEVYAHIEDSFTGKLFKQSMAGLYRVKRKQGTDVLEAWGFRFDGCN